MREWNWRLFGCQSRFFGSQILSADHFFSATPLNNTFMTMGPSLIGAFAGPPRTSNNVAPNGRSHAQDDELDDDAHGGWTENEGQDAARRGRSRNEGRGSSSGSNPGTTGNSPGASGSGSGGARGAETVPAVKADSRRTASESGIRTIAGDVDEAAS